MNFRSFLFGLPFPLPCIEGLMIGICAVSRTSRHTRWAARAAVSSAIQTLKAGDGGVEYVTLFAQFSQYVLQIHGIVPSLEIGRSQRSGSSPSIQWPSPGSFV